MAKETQIPWTRSTLNGWIGCTKISPGCDGCYAEVLDARFHASAHWGAGAPRMLTKDRTWNQVDRWNKEALASGEFWPVFCASQSDVFDNEVPDAWRIRLWQHFKSTPALTYQVVTKRIGNARAMLPEDWGDGYPNVWLIATVVNQDEALRDIRKLKSVPAAIHGLSIEPMLAPIDLFAADPVHGGRLIDGLGWVIVGGESRQGVHRPRAFDLAWCESIVAQCTSAGVPVFVKQMGHMPVRDGERLRFTGKGEIADEWPVHLRRREFPFGLSFREAA